MYIAIGKENWNQDQNLTFETLEDMKEGFDDGGEDDFDFYEATPIKVTRKVSITVRKAQNK